MNDFIGFFHQIGPKAQTVNRAEVFTVAEKDHRGPALETVFHGDAACIGRSDDRPMLNQRAGFGKFGSDDQRVHRFFHAVGVFDKDDHGKTGLLKSSAAFPRRRLRIRVH